MENMVENMLKRGVLQCKFGKFQGFFFVIVFLGVTIFCDKKIDWSVLFSSLLTFFLL